MKFLICLKKKFVKKYWLRKKLWRNNFRKLANFSYILAIFRRAITFFSGNMPVWIFDMLLSSSRSIGLCNFMRIGRYKFFVHSHETPYLKPYFFSTTWLSMYDLHPQILKNPNFTANVTKFEIFVNQNSLRSKNVPIQRLFIIATTHKSLS